MMLRKFKLLLPWLMSLATSAALSSPTCAQALPTDEARDLYSDTWVAVDDLKRPLPVAPRPPQSGKTAAMFYYIANSSSHHLDLTTDNVSHQNPNLLFDISKLLQTNPEKPAYGPQGHAHWWGEPLFGYYLNDDPWVIRKHLSMLSDAGVDVLFFDVTNSVTYRNTYMAICQVALQMRREGNRTPQIAFVTHARTAVTVTKLYQEFYKPNRYSELWFKWKNKPLLIGDPSETYSEDATFKNLPDFDDDYLPSPVGNWKKGDPLPDEIKNYFTFRKSWAWTAPDGWFGDGKGSWPWLDNTPQNPGLDETGKPEQIVVSAAQHPTTNKGKSYHDGAQPPIDKYGLTPETNQGLFFAEQWKRALEVDAPLVWVTQWNEWTASHYKAQADGGSFLGRPEKKGDSFFVDLYNAEYSRDIEPMKGGWGDNYYMQLADNLRRFKGARPTPVDKELRTPAGWNEWAGYNDEHRDTIGDNATRDWPGWGGKRYQNDSGRNDVTRAKVAADKTNLYFYVQTRDVLTPRDGSNWMQLLLNTDQDYATGWQGYDFLIAGSRGATESVVSRYADGKWMPFGRVKILAEGTQLQLTVPRESVGQAAKVAFDFKWSDAAPVTGDAKDFWVYGDSAPNGRFNYRYENVAP